MEYRQVKLDTGKDGKVRLGHRVGRNKHLHIEINRGRLVENDIDRRGLKEAYVNMNGCKR